MSARSGRGPGLPFLDGRRINHRDGYGVFCAKAFYRNRWQAAFPERYQTEILFKGGHA